MLSALGASAQTAIDVVEDFNVIPRYVAYYGDPIVYFQVYNEDNSTSFSLVDEDFNTTRTITYIPKTYDSGFTEKVGYFDLFDYSGDREAHDIVLTQTFFNDDEKIEYLVSEHKDEGCAWNVMNEDGKTIMSFQPENASHTLPYCAFIKGGEHYIVFENEANCLLYIYHIDKEHNSAEMVKTVKADGRFASAHDGMVNVSIDAADSDSDVILTNAAGQVVGREHIGQGQTSAALRTGRLQHGVYNVSLHRDGRIIKNEKLMIK